MKIGLKRVAGIATALVLAMATHERSAEACGACYASLSESTVVNDHKMALSISPNQTILWDQISYSGSPKEFAYVVPVRPGARVEASRESWLSSLDASTRPILMAPPSLSQGGSYAGDDDGPGCGCGMMSSMSDMAASSAGGGSADAGVQIVAREVVGPYEAVTLRSDDPEALQNWLTQNKFNIPDASKPIIAEFVEGKFDFIALRLRPGQGVREIQPIRIVSPGADLSLPLRMMQIGAASKLGITLWIIAEGRYRPKNFPEGVIDFEKLIWDTGQSRTNYQELSKAAMESANGRSFITEYADRLDSTASRSAGSGMTGNPALEDAYRSACYAELAAKPVPPPDEEDPWWLDAGNGDGGRLPFSADAGADAGEDGGTDEADAGPTTDPDAGAGSGETSGVKRPAKDCDDLEVALDGMVRRDAIWIARFRANLPYEALAETLVLEPHPEQVPITNIHTAKDVGTISAARIAASRTNRLQGTWATIAVTAFAVSRLAKRRKKK
jgi:hypothetical protein